MEFLGGLFGSKEQKKNMESWSNVKVELLDPQQGVNLALKNTEENINTTVTNAQVHQLGDEVGGMKNWDGVFDTDDFSDFEKWFKNFKDWSNCAFNSRQFGEDLFGVYLPQSPVSQNSAFGSFGIPNGFHQTLNEHEIQESRRYYQHAVEQKGSSENLVEVYYPNEDADIPQKGNEEAAKKIQAMFASKKADFVHIIMTGISSEGSTYYWYGHAVIAVCDNDGDIFIIDEVANIDQGARRKPIPLDVYLNRCNNREAKGKHTIWFLWLAFYTANKNAIVTSQSWNEALEQLS